LGIDSALPAAEVLALLLLAALAAGWVDAVVGGGGLIQLPALLLAFPGAAPLTIVATNKVSSVWGTTLAALVYARRLPRRPYVVATLLVAAAVGAAAGAALAGALPQRWLTPLALGALVIVATLVVLQPGLGVRGDGEDGGTQRGRVVLVVSLVVTGAVVGFWDGVFGPGTGTLLTIGLVAWSGYAFLDATGLAKAANVVTNIVAIVVFTVTFAGRGDAFPAQVWGVGLAMGAANLAGGWLGAHTALARGSGFVRAVFLAVVAALLIRLAWTLVG